MKSVKKIVLSSVLIIIFTYIFIFLNTGEITNQVNQVIQPLAFAVSVAVCIFYPKYKKFIIQTSLVLLLFMVISYLLNLLEISNWVGSLGFGLLITAVFSYLPQLVRSGYIEKY